jgi:ammonia channel protein AmtB
MSAAWDSLAAAEDTVVAASGMANAWYFGGRALASTGPRRRAGVLLTSLSGGAAALALALLAGDRAEGWPGAVARLPLLLGSVSTSLLVVAGRGR